MTRGSPRILLTAVLLATGMALAVPAAAHAAPPAGVTAVALDGRVELAWQPVAGATGYKVYRGTSAGAVTTPLMASPLIPPDLTVPAVYTDIGATNGTAFFYAARAIENGVESANSHIVKATPRARSCSGGNTVVQENCFPGDTDWDVVAAPQAVSGFATAQSIDRGDSVDLKVQGAAGATVDLEIFRTGHYGGDGARLFSTVLAVPLVTQPGCVSDPNLGLLDCANWSVTQRLTTTASWPSGAYLIRVRRNDSGDENHILLAVRDDDRTSEILYDLPFSTYQAYNNWGGKSLYDDKSTGATTVAGSARAVKVSFDRPYQQPHDGIQHDWYTRADFATVRWLERWGYDVSYGSVTDMERNPGRALDHRVLISGAHDEYYSSAMRGALEQARERGVDLFFTGANDVYWKVRFEPSPVSGKQDQVLVNYKSTQSGGPDPSGIATGTWRDPAGANRPENGLTGALYMGQKPFDYYPLRVSAAEGQDRIWRYTGLENLATGATATIGSGIVGWEWDTRVSNGQEPAGTKTLSSSPASGDILQDAGRNYAPGTITSNATKYTWPSGSLVVDTGTNHWNWGLATNSRGDGEPERRIQQATTNILLDMGAAPETPPSTMVLDDPAAPPLITLRSPATNATDVLPTTSVRATFSRPMEAASITGATFVLRRPDGTAVPATVTYDDVTFIATLTPAAALDLETAYTATLAGTVRAANGVALGTPATWSFTTKPPDRTAPTVSITAPTNGSTVIASTTVTASATDDTAVSGVQFKLDGENLGAEDTAAPYSFAWDAKTVSAGTHQLTAVARDPAGNSRASTAVSVTVDPTGLVGAYGFEETAGTSVTDASGRGNAGTIAGAAARNATGRFGRSITFDGVDDMVNVPDASSLDLTTAMTLEAWAYPTVNSSGSWRTVALKEQSGGLVYGVYSNTDTNRPSAHAYTAFENDTRGTAQLPVNAWAHLAASYDGANLRLYLNGTLVSSKPVTGSMLNGTGALRIGGNSVWGEFFAGRLDEVRLYRRVLTAAEIQADMAAPITPGDTQAPTAPGSLTATGAIGRVQLSWNAATDNTAVDHYNVHRGTSAGFTPSAANRVAQVSGGTSYNDAAIPAGTYFYRVTAEDAVANVGPASNEASGTATADTTAPTVSLTAPTAGATVTNSVTVTANAADNVGVAGVQFRLDGANLGAEDASAPFSAAWDTRSVANGAHTLTAIARDGGGNTTTAQSVSVNVDNPPVDTSGLVGAWGFEEGTGSFATDTSSQANTGSIAGATRTAAGRFGEGLAFDGVNDMVTVPDASSLDLTTGMTLEAWVRPSVLSNWRTLLLKEQASGLAYGAYANSATNRPSAHVFVGGEQDARGSAALPLNTWSHVAATFNGSTLLLYVDGTEVGSRALSGSLPISTGALRMGGNSFDNEFFGGTLDEVRVYNRPLTAGEVQADMNTAVVPAVVDATPPSAVSGLTATGGIGQAQLSWSAASDNLGVTRYNVHRSSTSGFTPSSGNRVAQVTSGTTYSDTGLPAGIHYYRVTAQDAAGNVGPSSGQAQATATSDTTAPTVSLTAPAAGATVLGGTPVTANAADNVAVAGVQFRLDGADLGTEDTSAPYSISWDTLSTTNGPHTLAAIARDGVGNRTTAQSVTVTVNNPPVDTTGLVGAWGFEEATGTVAEDTSTAGNDGAVAGASWSDAGRFGHALSFDGIDDRVNVADANTLDLSDGMTLEAWVKPSQHADWRTVALKESGGGALAYALYSSAWDDRPSGHITTTGEVDTRGTAQLPLNEWRHLATTYDGTTLRLYVDGVQVSSRTVGGLIGASASPLRIGGNAVWGEYFKGLIDEVRVYRRALTAAQILQDKDRPVSESAPPPAGPDRTGQFAAPVSWPLVPVHVSMLSNGKVAVWDGFDAALNSERIWDPATGSFDPIPNGRNLFCAAHVTLPDGRLFVAGGHVAANEGIKDTNLFNPQTRTWARGADMARARWYPTATTLPDGRILVVSGDNITVNAPGQPVPLRNGSETLPEIYDVGANTWTPLPAGQRRMPLYPFMFVLPDGRLFDAGPDRTTRTFNTTTGQWTTVGTSPVDGHSAVMYRPGKILKSGTWADVDYPGIVASNGAAAIDMNEASPTWRSVAPMHHGRSYHTLTALPDGTVLATGGGSESDGVDPTNAVFPTEIWDPVTDTWTEVAAHQRPRLYHSSSLLLPDGRVLLAGGGAFGTAPNESNAEIYSPPYLFKGPRPTITDVPTTLRYGQSFTVQTPDAARIQNVSLVRMGSVTHNFDMDQRFMHLPMQSGGAGQLTVDGPSNANVAPPGYYYVIVNDDNGVPSVGKIVKIDPPATDSQAPTAPPNLTAAVQEQDVALTWDAATDDRGVTEYRVHRSTTSGFTPTAGNRIATLGASARSYTDRSLANGTYRYQVVAADAAGNVGPASREESVTVQPDTTGPTISVSAPTAGSTVAGSAVAVNATASDNRGVTRVQFELDGADLGAADTSSPYSATWNTRSGTNGTHVLTAVAYDAAGNSTRSAPVSVTVDNGSPPTVSITAPAAGATVTGTATITANAADDRGVASVQFKLGSANLGSPDTSAPYSASWDTRTATNGAQTLSAVATDTDGGTTASSAVQVNVDNPITGLVAAYSFDEPSGLTATDTSGSGLNGTVGGGATRSTAGKNGGAVSFDGVDDMVTVADANPLDLTTGMTLEAWVNPTTLTRWRTVLMKEQTADVAYALYANTDANRPSTNVWAGTERDALGTSQLPLNAWTHLASTYDGATLRLYVNGVQVGSRAFTGSLATSTRPLRIGGNAIWSEWFTGMLDDVRVYNRALPAAEIQSDMARPVAPAP